MEEFPPFSTLLSTYWINGDPIFLREDFIKCTRWHLSEECPWTNGEMVERLIDEGRITTALVECAFRAVDRKNYMDGCIERYLCCYREITWKFGNLCLLPPCIYAEVMESLCLEAGLSFLNIGSGSGYLNTLAGLILGEYGINHGVEIRPDVFRFAEKKLKEFKDTSSALHKLEFCEPKFVVGNFLLLNEEPILYDRVYCGLSVPTEYERYMKNRVKVGGILIMELDGQLVKITRTGEETWDEINLFAVTFDPLTQPDFPNDIFSRTSVTLPDIQPMKLQEICRLNIRRSIRCSMEAKYSYLKAVTRIPLQKTRDIGRTPNASSAKDTTNAIIDMLIECSRDNDHSQSVKDPGDYLVEFMKEFKGDTNSDCLVESDTSDSDGEADSENCLSDIKISDIATKTMNSIYGMHMNANICELEFPKRLKQYLKCRSCG